MTDEKRVPRSSDAEIKAVLASAAAQAPPDTWPAMAARGEGDPGTEAIGGKPGWDASYDEADYADGAPYLPTGEPPMTDEEMAAFLAEQDARRQMHAVSRGVKKVRGAKDDRWPAMVARAAAAGITKGLSSVAVMALLRDALDVLHEAGLLTDPERAAELLGVELDGQS